MTNLDIYKDISARTGGAVMIGVVGPVRTGKSTFIKRFMETLVIPNIDGEYRRERAIDELPQSSAAERLGQNHYDGRAEIRSRRRRADQAW